MWIVGMFTRLTDLSSEESDLESASSHKKKCKGAWGHGLKHFVGNQ